MSSPTVKAIVVRSPYAQQIADGSKPIEYRCWKTHYRGWLAIVAARRRESGTDAGRVVCLVRITDCVEVGPKEFEWMLADPIPLTNRVELPGRLGLFDVSDQMPAQAMAVLTMMDKAPQAAAPPKRTAKRKAAPVARRSKPAREADDSLAVRGSGLCFYDY